MNNMVVDRTHKEDVSYIKNDNVSLAFNEDIHLSDMYNFVKDDLFLAEFNPVQEIEEEYDMEGFPITLPSEKERELGFLGQDLLTSTNPVVDLILNTKQARKHNTALVCNQDNYINILAGALKQAIEKIEVLESKIEQLENK